MIDWGKVPWSLWAIVALLFVELIVAFLTVRMPVGAVAAGIVIVPIWAFFLLRAVRWLWIGTVLLSALSITLDLAIGIGTWHGDVLTLVGLGLLVLPATRRFFGKSVAAAAA